MAINITITIKSQSVIIITIIMRSSLNGFDCFVAQVPLYKTSLLSLMNVRSQICIKLRFVSDSDLYQILICIGF